MHQLFVVDESAELQKYFAEWPKPKKLFRFMILGSLYRLMVALAMSDQKVAFCSFYVMPSQNTFRYCGNLVPVSFLPLTLSAFFLKSPIVLQLLLLFFSYLTSIFTFLSGCQNSSGSTGFTCMFFVLFPDGSLFCLVVHLPGFVLR